jgi:Putative citrate transport
MQGRTVLSWCFFKLAGIRLPRHFRHRWYNAHGGIGGSGVLGGLTHIGNAPNMMLRGIAAHRGVRCFAFKLLASPLLLPVLALVGLLFFAQRVALSFSRAFG